ncbi:MAG: hypothetical protein R2747_06945 [Pyrinomonadaceae bacterium]
MRIINLEHHSDLPIGSVRPVFEDFVKFGEAHPLITRVEKINDSEAVFFESVRILGIVPHKFSYRAKLEKNDGGDHFVMKAEPKPGVFLELEFDLRPNGEGTRINERISIGASSLTAWFLGRAVVKSHRELVENIGKS